MIGVSVGAVVNLVMTRSEELKRGIPVADAQGNDLGRSQLAARTALAQCSATRVAWTVALLTLAPIASGAALRLHTRRYHVPSLLRSTRQPTLASSGSPCLYALPSSRSIRPGRRPLR